MLEEKPAERSRYPECNSNEISFAQGNKLGKREEILTTRKQTKFAYISLN